MRRSGVLVLIASLALVAGCATATLLPDGRVLLLNIVAKVYDPTTGRVSNLATPSTIPCIPRRRCSRTARCSSREGPGVSGVP